MPDTDFRCSEDNVYLADDVLFAEAAGLCDHVKLFLSPSILDAYDAGAISS
jgi:hypothetical protein